MRPHTSRAALFLVLIGTLLGSAAAPSAQIDIAKRRATRDRLGVLLADYGPKVDIDFQRNETNEFNFSGRQRKSYKNADEFEVVMGVTDNDTITLAAYPHYKGGYINVDKARNGALLTRRMTNLTYHNFLGWAADDEGDICATFQITLESGFPDEVIKVVLRSVELLDEFIGQMRPDIDGTSAP